jgi:hypothetical protein
VLVLQCRSVQARTAREENARAQPLDRIRWPLLDEQRHALKEQRDNRLVKVPGGPEKSMRECGKCGVRAAASVAAKTNERGTHARTGSAFVSMARTTATLTGAAAGALAPLAAPEAPFAASSAGGAAAAASITQSAQLYGSGEKHGGSGTAARERAASRCTFGARRARARVASSSAANCARCTVILLVLPPRSLPTVALSLPKHTNAHAQNAVRQPRRPARDP